MPQVKGAPSKMNEIMEGAYSACMAKYGDKEKCSKIAWGAVSKAGYQKSGNQWKRGKRV